MELSALQCCNKASVNAFSVESNAKTIEAGS